MKRINHYKKLFSVENEIDLKILKTTYRNLVKEWHPDKFQEGDSNRKLAEVQSQEIINGYHFLVSIAPETIAASSKSYNETITKSSIASYSHKGLLLEITFLDGNTYEYFGVTKSIYVKMINSNKLNRFAKRTIYPKHLYRKSKRTMHET